MPIRSEAAFVSSTSDTLTVRKASVYPETSVYGFGGGSKQPVVLEHARLRPGRGFKPLRAALYFAQRGITQPTIHAAITAGIVAAINWRHPVTGGQGDEICHAPDCSATLRSLEAEGVAILPQRLTEQVKEMNRFLSDQPVMLSSGERVHRERMPPGCTMADYRLETVLNCPHVLSVANSDFVIRTATRYLGCLPTISTLRIWWLFPGSRLGASAPSFHRDRDDWRCLKLFVYLTDVDETSGPHHFVRGSHRTQPELFWCTYDAKTLEKAFGRDAMCVITGTAGTAFLEATIGLHAGPIPIRQPRLVLQVGYTLLPRFSRLYKPMEVQSRPAVDKYINRLFIR
ncbi:MAG: hypothetical protein ACREK6_05365 [Candidatus Rokuibacteriota bacterium]